MNVFIPPISCSKAKMYAQKISNNGKPDMIAAGIILSSCSLCASVVVLTSKFWMGERKRTRTLQPSHILQYYLSLNKKCKDRSAFVHLILMCALYQIKKPTLDPLKNKDSCEK